MLIEASGSGAKGEKAAVGDSRGEEFDYQHRASIKIAVTCLLPSQSESQSQSLKTETPRYRHFLLGLGPEIGTAIMPRQETAPLFTAWLLGVEKKSWFARNIL